MPPGAVDDPIFRVTDWERKLKYAPFEKKNAVVRNSISKLDDIQKLTSSPDWKFHSENKLGNKVWIMDDPTTGVKAVKGECWIPYPADQLFYMITDITDDRKIFDPLFNKCELIEKYGQNTFLMWQLTNRIGPIAPRDFVIVVHGNIVGFLFF